MSLDPGRVETVFFDSYSTIVDVDSVVKALEKHLEDTNTESVSRLWRTRSLEYTFVGNYIDEYKPFYEMNRDALEYSLKAHGVDLSKRERDEILEVYHNLDVFDDVRDNMRLLRDSGYDLYVLSNGNPEMLESMVESAGIRGLIEDYISADEIETFKPAPEIYEHGAERADTPIDRIAHASAGWFDVQGAMHAGMQGVWVNRKDDPWETFDGKPDLTVSGFKELADALV
ncbi:MAG: haloacid dehalogenase type II [Halobacteria archaeon]|nr:haloacid dehalogenase type II [Halobacteria archaeon]